MGENDSFMRCKHLPSCYWTNDLNHKDMLPGPREGIPKATYFKLRSQLRLHIFVDPDHGNITKIGWSNQLGKFPFNKDIGGETVDLSNKHVT